MSENFPPPPPPPPASGGGGPASDDNTMAVLAHAGGLILGFVAPLLVMLLKGESSPYVRRHAVEALNFQITMAIGYVASFLLTFVVIGAIGFIVLPVLTLIFCILGAIAASKGQDYKYPLSIRLVK